MDTTPVVTVFRSRLRPGVDEDYGPLANRMEALARTMPGFVDFKGFVAPDGERVSIVTFADMAAQRAWRDHPDHRAAQQRGRRDLYEWYSVQVCTLVSEHRFPG